MAQHHPQLWQKGESLTQDSGGLGKGLCTYHSLKPGVSASMRLDSLFGVLPFS